MARKSKESPTTEDVAKAGGIAYRIRKLIGGITKLAIVAGITAAVVKIVRRANASPAT